jgi:hypothetical protein
MDFYTIKTSVDVDTDMDAFNALLSTIGFFSQPLIVGDPHLEDGSFLFRFAVRMTTLNGHEEQILKNLSLTGFGFTTENTELVRAARI